PGTVDRARLVAFAGRYLGFRARTFPAAPEAGASPGRLLDMARANAAEALGAEAARRLDRFAPDLAALERQVRRIETDHRLLPCYLAFQMGYCALAAHALAGLPEEAARLRAASDGYATRLRGIVAGRS